MTDKEQAIEYIKGYRKLDEKLYNVAPKGTVSSNATKKCLEFWDIAIQALSQESKIGHWVKHDTGHSTYYSCSLCGCVAPCTETADKILWKMSNYCPDCGARMKSDGEQWVEV